jgi:hypothetical protein
MFNRRASYVELKKMMTSNSTTLAESTDHVNAKQSGLLPHLLELPGGQWAVWRTVALRGAGFPASDVLKLADADCARAADQLFEAEDAAHKARNEVLAVLWRDLELVDETERPLRKKAIRQLQKKKPGRLTGDSASVLAVTRYDEAHAVSESARTRFHVVFQSAMERTSRSICEVANSKAFCEAVIWQNRHAYLNGVVPLLRTSAENNTRSSKQRQHEELVANYLQRYCVKNDTIGFFGPVGWAKFLPQGEGINVRPGESLLATRNVRFETWGIDALADSLFKSEALTPWAMPRQTPLIYLEGNVLRRTFQSSIRLTAKQAAVLRACDGERTAKDIVNDLLQIPELKFKGADGVYYLLKLFRQKGLVTWSFSVPLPYKLHTEETLLRLCERIDDEDIRAPLSHALREMEEARCAIAAAAGDPERLEHALSDMEAKFTDLTGVGSKRSAGQMYAARTLVYEDCCRNVEVDIGPPILEALGAPLSLLLSSARWFTYEVAALYRHASDEIYEQCVSQFGTPLVEAAHYWTKVREIVMDIDKSLAHIVLPAFQEKWAEIFNLTPGARRVEFTSDELRPRVLAAFEAPRPGWQSARHNSPDVMIAADSAEAIRRGDFQLVLGEMHMAGVTLANWIFLGQHPAPEELFGALENDLHEPRVMPLMSKHYPGVTARTTTSLISPKDVFLEYSLETTDVPSARSLRISELVIEKRASNLIVRTLDGRAEFDIIEFVGGGLSNIVMNFFKIIAPRQHTPRVTIDKLIVARESWAFSPSELQFANEKDETERFLAARLWARTHGMPRFIFAKTPVEVKPFFVDFDSPIYINILAKLIRRTVTNGSTPMPLAAPASQLITFSEMLPTPDQTWLTDAAGQTYTSELRIITVSHNE